ncbi:MAG: ABC transporter permease [Actinomycetaceae bacterium]|nr:ABC transporter permease [Actinomycetaceae bacterium]
MKLPALTAWGRALLKRVGSALIVVWLVATAVFAGMRLIPGDPAEAVMGGPGSQASAEALAAARAEFGLDLPWFQQYLNYLGRIATFDLGKSYSLRRPVAQVIWEVFPPTLTLALVSLLLAWILALGLAAVAAGTGRVGKVVTAAVEIVAAALPHFWLGSVLVIVFATGLGWLPATFDGTLPSLVLPALTLALPTAGFLSHLMRDSIAAAMVSPFALVAQARGETRWRIFLVHGLRHAAIPALSLSGWALSAALSGAVVVEQIFARPGLGRALVGAVLARDIPLVTGVTLVSAVIYVVVMALVDSVQVRLDPRVAQASGDANKGGQ